MGNEMKQEVKNEGNKLAVVTGASRGIGRAIAKELAACGSRVVLNYSGSGEAAAEVKREIECDGGSAVLAQWDVTDAAACDTWMQRILREYGRIDILVNNAGITRDGLLVQMKEEAFERVLAVNLDGAFHMIRAAARPMIRQKSGRIVNVTSIVGIHGNSGQANYSASKAGLIGLTKSAAQELASRGITVNAVAPGFIQTAMTDRLPSAVRENAQNIIPMRRFGTPEEVAAAVGFLTSEAAAYITGHILRIDGGFHM